VPQQPKAANLRLRALLDEANMSNKGLARRVADLGQPEALRTSATTTPPCCDGWLASSHGSPRLNS